MDKNNKQRTEYKHTYLGRIPKDWNIHNLIQLSENGISNGVFNDPRKVGKGFRLINVLDLYHEPEIDISNLNRLDIEQDEFLRNKVHVGDIFFTRSSLKLEGIAHCNILLDEANDITFDGHIMKISPKKEFVLSHYLRLYCISSIARKYFMCHAKQNTMTTIGQEDISGLPVLLPPRNEQKEIVFIINLWDNAIEKLQQLITLKEYRKKAIMQRLLNENNCITKYFKGNWKRQLFKDILIPISRPINKPTSNFLALGIRSHCKGIFLKPEFDPSKIEMDMLYEVKTNDLIVNITFAWEGAIAIAGTEDDGALVSHRFPTFLINQKNANVDYIRYVILQPKFRYLLGLISPGGAGRNRVLDKADFLNLELKFPSLEEQTAIASILQTADKELNILKQKLDALKDQKKGLMQKLLTGQIRVKVKR